MDRIRLIASDMDATLLDEQSQLPADFEETIHALAELGIRFAPASGRPLYTLEAMFPTLQDELVFIGDNGGAIRWKGQNLFTSEMSPEGWRALNRLTREQGDIAVLCGLESAYVERPFAVHDAVLRHFYTKIEYVDRLEDVAAPADKFTIYLHSTMRSRPTIRSMPSQRSIYSVAVAGECWVDIMNPRCPQGCRPANAGAAVGLAAGMHDGLWRYLQRCRDAAYRKIRFSDGKRQRTAAPEGSFSGPFPPGSRCHAGLTPCSGTERLCLSGGFYPGTLNSSIKNGAVTHLV